MIEATMVPEYVRDYEQLLNQPTLPLQFARDLYPSLNVNHSGKVRDIYDLGEELLIVATDRISTYDVTHPTPISHKGIVLTLMSVQWMCDPLRGIMPNHFVTADVENFPVPFRDTQELKGRSMLVKKLNMIDVECIARGYITGSAWEEYQKSGTACGIKLPSGLVESQKLPEPQFTPTTKARTGHDENISFKDLCAMVGTKLARRLREATLELYTAGADYALQRGVIIADTKFEFGFPQGSRYDYDMAVITERPMPRLILGDEVLTPDSSRFWPADQYEPGRPQPSMDKQGVRDWAASTGWDKKPPAPEIPDNLVRETSQKYKDIYYRLFGKQRS